MILQLAVVGQASALSGLAASQVVPVVVHQNRLVDVGRIAYESHFGFSDEICTGSLALH